MSEFPVGVRFFNEKQNRETLILAEKNEHHIITVTGASQTFTAASWIMAMYWLKALLQADNGYGCLLKGANKNNIASKIPRV